MVMTAIQRRQRKLYLGASDIAAILGVDPYRNSYAVYLDKTEETPDEDFENPAMEIGTMLEPGVLSWAEKHLGKLRRGGARRVNGAPIKVHLDARIEETGEPVEAKTTAILFSGAAKDNWGDEGTDQVPEHIIIQAQTQLAACPQAAFCHIPALIGGRGFVMFKVARDQELIDYIIREAKNFWHNHVKKRIPPEAPDGCPSPFAKRAKRSEGKETNIPENLINAWLDIKAELNSVVEEKDRVEGLIHAELLKGDAEVGICEGIGRITYFSSESSRIDTKLFKTELPEIAERFTKKTTSRTLRWCPEKKKKTA